MLGHGDSRSDYDSCVYHRKLPDGSFVYFLLYVDDMLIAAKSMVEINKVKTQLSGEFEMKDLGAAKKILAYYGSILRSIRSYKDLSRM